MTKHHRRTAELNRLERWAKVGAELEEGSRSRIARAIRAGADRKGRGSYAASYLAAVAQAIGGDTTGASYILGASSTLGRSSRSRCPR